MKFLVFLFFFYHGNAFAQFDNLFKLFKPVPNNINANNSKNYQFIQPPKNKKIGNFKVSCTTAAGMAIPEITNLQIKQVDTGFSNYTFITLDGKQILAPIDFCIIIQN